MIVATIGLAVSSLAQSHVVLEQPKATGGSSYRASFRVGHGCAGAPTTGISVRIPDGVQGAKPMPKPGWTLTTRSEKLATPYTSHGRRVEADVVEITWTAMGKGNALPDAHYDEFVLRAGLPVKAGPLWFKVVQTCDENGRVLRNEWTQVPAEGISTRGLASPAALLVVEPSAEAHHH
jgi:hypothetical protein